MSLGGGAGRHARQSVLKGGTGAPLGGLEVAVVPGVVLSARGRANRDGLVEIFLLPILMLFVLVRKFILLPCHGALLRLHLRVVPTRGLFVAALLPL